MQDLIWSGRPKLRRPVMVCAFKGWNDAGEAASAAVSFIHESFDAEDVASIDPEEFFDFTAVRPTVRLTEGLTREIDWPSATVSAAAVPGAEGDLVMFQATEPSLRWRRYTDNLVAAARELDVRMVITLGALLADVPHSRPVAITGLASDQGLVDKLRLQRTTYEGPTGIVRVLHHACASAGIECAADDYERQVSAAVASDPEVKAFVERLESAMDEVEDDEPDEESLPSADTIARDFQRFLRQRGPEN